MSQGTLGQRRRSPATWLGIAVALLVAPGVAGGQAAADEHAHADAPPVQGLEMRPHAPTVDPGASITLTVDGITGSGGEVSLDPDRCTWQVEDVAGELEPDGCQARYTAPSTGGTDRVTVSVDAGDRLLTSQTRVTVGSPADAPAAPVPCEGVVAYGPDTTGLPGGFACGTDLVVLPDEGAPSTATGAEATPLEALPEGTPSPPSQVPLERVVEITLTGPEGDVLHEVPSRVLFTLDERWQAEHCPEAACRPTLFHLAADGWETLETERADPDGDPGTYVARTPGFSLFAVGGVPAEGADGLFAGLDVVLLAGAAIVTSGGVGVWAVTRSRRRDGPAAGAASQDRALQALRGGEMARFVDSVTHDIANPLTPISMHLQRLIRSEGEELSEEQLEALEVVSRNVDHLDRLVADLREAARLEAGELSLDRTVLDLNDLVADAVGTFEPQADEHDVDLELAKHAASLPVYADPDRIRQVLYNLVKNAIHATAGGGQVQVEVTRRGEVARVVVEDTGCGFDPAMSERLFEPFSQLPDDAEGGSGLGLFISRGLVERHGGSLEAGSPGPGRGATFTAELPLWGR